MQNHLFELRHLPATPVLRLCQALPPAALDAFFRAAFSQLSARAHSLGLEPPRAFYTLTHPLQHNLLACEAGFALPRAAACECLPAANPVSAACIPAGVYACGAHRGPYDQCAATRAALCGFARGLGWHPHPAAYEWFSCALQHLPAELCTELWLPLQPPAPVFNLCDENLFLA